MIPVATEMRNAIRAGANQRALLYFVEQGLYFTVNDIVLGSFKYTGAFNPDTELTMGKTVSAQLEYSLVNEDEALMGFTFGEFNAYMGVKMGQFPYMVGTANVVVDFQGNRYAGYSTAPYLTKNGEPYPTQPAAPVEALIAIDDTLYCISSNRTVTAIRQTNATHWEDLENKTWLSQEVYTWDSYEGSYSVWTTTITDELTWAICKRYIEKGAGVALTDNNKSLIFKDGVAEEYWYTQIGHFYAERPARVRTNTIAVTAYDAMYARLNELAVGLTTPTTVQGLFDQVVTNTGVISKATGILNGSMPVPSIDFSEMTYREVLELIAQASCSYALFDYDGRLDLRWFTRTNISIDEHNYKECIPYEYTVKTIDKFQARSTDSDVGIIVGTGTNGYVLQNNPFFVFDSDAAGRPYCQNIYNRLHSLGEYTPLNVSWFVDFTMQPGDIITVGYKDETFTFPIFMQNYTWTGINIGTSDCTGSEYREVLNATNRRVWREQTADKRRYTEITSDIEGLVVKTGVDNLSTDETLYSKITANASAISAEVTRATTAEGTLSGKISVNATNISAEVTRATTAEGTLSGKIDVNATNISAEVTRATTAEGTLSGKISVNATNISAEVTRATTAEGTLSSSISANATSITTLVTKTGINNLGGNDTLYSKISQNAESISAEVTRATGIEGTLSSSISANATSITTLVTKTGINNLGGNDTLYSKIEQNATAITSKVSAGDIASTINQTAQSVKISASKIEFEGLVTANNNFKILTDGSMEAKNGKFSGTMTAGNWTFNSDGSKYTNNTISVNMTVLTGGAEMVGGGSDYRAFYGSSGCDVQYGADYNYQTIIRSKNIKIISQVGSVSDFRSAEFKKIDSANDMTFVCGESTGNTSGSAKGNIGCEAQAWDTAWIRSLRYYTQSAYSARALKHDIKDMPEMGEILDQLKPVTFAYIGESRIRNGLIYEDTYDVYPTICVEPQATGNEASKYGSINYLDLVPVLLREIQSLRRRVAGLEVA